MSTHTHLLGGYLCCLSSTAEQEIYKTPRVYLFYKSIKSADIDIVCEFCGNLSCCNRCGMFFVSGRSVASIYTKSRPVYSRVSSVKLISFVPSRNSTLDVAGLLSAMS